MSAPVVHHQQNRCMNQFHEAGAIDSQTAASLDEIGVRDSLVLRYLKSRGVIVKDETERYYIDLEAEQHFRHRRMVFTVSLIVAILVILIVILLAVTNT